MCIRDRPKTAQRILDELATSRITIKAEPDQQPEFKHRSLGRLFYLLYELQKKNLLPSETVSYTHLRAHETVLDLVCRLLLEKKKH